MDKVKSYAFWFFKSFIWLGILLLVIDIVTKNVVVNNMNEGDTVPLIQGFLHITYTVNTAAAFGLGVEGDNAYLINRIVYIVVASLASAIIIAVYVKQFKKLGKMYKACMMMILVGALGNLIDRIFFTPEYLKYPYVGVVDWIDFRGIWPYIFNWADSCIVVGVIILIVWLIIEEVRDAKKRNAVTLKKDVVEAKIQAQAEQKVEEPLKEESTPVEEEKPEVKKEAPKKKASAKKAGNTKKNAKK